MSRPLLAVRLALFVPLVLWVPFALANQDAALALLEHTISADGHIQNRPYVTFMVGALLLTLALIVPSMLERWKSELPHFSQGHWRTDGSELLLILALVLIHAVGIVQSGLSPHYSEQGIYREDALLEYLSVLFAIAGAVLLLTGKASADRPSRILAVLAAFGTILFAGEEISWGQRIFGIESTGIFAEANFQHETNIHNFFNPVILLVQTMINFAVGIWLLNARAATRWLVDRFACADIEPLLNPRNSLILAPIMFGLGLHCAIFGSELSEEVLAVMLFYGSLRFILASRAGRSPPGAGARREARAFLEREGGVEDALLVEGLAYDLEAER